MKKEKESFARWLGEKGTSFYLVCMPTLFPVFYTDKLFNLTKDKQNFFLFVTFLYVWFLLPGAVTGIKSIWKEKRKIRRWDTVFALILLAAAALSVLLAADSKKAFLGMSSRTVSGLCFLCCVLIYFGVRAYGSYDSIVIWSWLTGSAAIYLFGILCACKINFLHIQDGIFSPEIQLTPLGNTNFNACFVSLMLPLAMAMYMLCREVFSQIVYGINLCMGFLFTLFIKTESAFIAIVFGMLLLGYFAVENTRWLWRYFQMIGIYLGAKTGIFLLLYFFESHLYPFDGIGRHVLKGWWIFAEILCYVLLFFTLKKWDGRISEMVCRIRNYVLGAGVILAVLGGICVIGINILADKIPGDSLFRYLILRDETFNSRGFIWKGTVRLLKEEPLGRLLFGNGPNCYDDFMSAAFCEESLAWFGSQLRDPHNEFLQMFVDMGLLGVAGYFGLLGVTLVRACRMWKKNELQIVVVLTLCVYLLQGLVNGYSIYHLPILFLFLGLANGSIGNSNGGG